MKVDTSWHLIDCIAAPVLVISQQGVIAHANPAILALLGIAGEDELIGSELHQLLSRESVLPFDAFLDDMLEAPASQQLVLEAPSGEHIPVLFSGTMLPDQGGGESLTMVTVLDLRGQAVPGKLPNTTEEDIRWLAEQGRTLLTMEVGDEILQLATETLQDKLGKCIVISLSKLDEDTLQLEHIAGIDSRFLSQVWKLVGGDYHQRLFPIDDQFRDTYGTRSLYQHEGGLEDFAISQVPASISKKLAQMVGVETIYTIGLEGLREVVGCFYIFSLAPDLEMPTSLIESFVFQVAMALEKSRISEDLEESENRFEAFFEFAPDGYYISDLKGTFITGNRAAEEITGYARSELVGKSFLQAGLISGDQLSKASKLLARNALGKSTGPDEMILTRKDGSKVPVEVSTYPMKIAEQAVVLGIARDISYRKKTEEDLERANQSVTRVLEGMDAHVYVADLESYEILYMNKRMIEDFGGDFTGKICYQVFRDQSERCPDCTIDQLVDPQGQPGEVVEWESQNPKTGRWYKNYDRVIYWTDQRLVKLQIAVDITAGIESSQALQESEKRYRNLFEDSHNALMTISPPEWNFISGNQAMLALFQLEDQEQFLALKPWDLSPEFQPDGQPSREKAREMISVAVEKGSHFFSWTHRTRSGNDFPATVHLTRVDLGEEFIISAAVQDRSDQVWAETIMQRQMAELTLVNTLNSLANQGSDIQQILDVFGQETKQIFKANTVHVYMLDAAGQQMEVVQLSPTEDLNQALQQAFGKLLPDSLKIELAEGSHYQELVSKQEPTIITDPGQILALMKEMAADLLPANFGKRQFAGLLKKIQERSGISSMAVVPLRSEGSVIGLVDLSLPYQFSEQELDVLQTLADQLSVIINRIQVSAERQLHLSENEFISNTLNESVKTDDVDILCARLAENVWQANPDTYVMISLYDPAVNAIRIRALEGLGRLANRLVNLLGRKPEEIHIEVTENPLDEDLNQRFTSGKLELVPGGLYELTRRTIPKRVCQAVERIAGVEEIYIVGFGLRGQSTGGLVLLVKEGKKIQFPDAIESIANHYAVVFERKIVQEEIMLRKAQLEALRNVELEIANQLEQEQLLQTIAEEARKIVNAEATGFSIINRERDVLEYLAYTGLHDLPENTDIHRGEGLSGKVWDIKQTLIVENYAEWEGHSTNWEGVGNYNLVGLPVIWGEEFLGVLEIATDLEHVLTSTEINTLELFAIQAAIAVKNAHLYQEEMMRRQEAETLREVGLMINRMMDREDLLDMILSSLKKVVPYHGASIQLVEGNQIMIEAYAGPQPADEVVGIAFQINDNPISGMILHEGKQIILSNREQVEKLLRGPTIDDIQSFIAVPLEIKGNRIGVIALDHSQPNQYSQRDVRLVTDFATQASIALENNRLFDEIQRRTQEIELVYESAMQLTQELHPDLLFEHLQTQIGSMFDQDGFLLATYNEDTSLIEIVYASEDGFQHEHANGLEIPLDERNSLLSWIVRKKTPLMIGNVENDSLPVQPLQQGKTIRSWLGVPLLVSNRVIGALVVQSYRAHAFTHEDQRLLELLGNQAAVALENSRLFDEAQTRLSRLSSLHEIDLAISGSVDLELTMEVLLNQLITSLDVDAACVLVYKPETQSLEYVSSRGFETRSLQYTSLKVGDGLAGQAAQERSLVRIPDLRQQQTSLDKSPLLNQEGFVSYLAHPLIAKGELVGVLEVFHRERLDPSMEWINFLDALASVAGIAIDRLNLFQDLSRSNFELQQAYDATIEGWARAIDMRDNNTSEHSRRVVALTMNLARKLGIEAESLTHIRRGALLHDIGKMAIPDGVLLKTGKLTDEEWRLMKKHPQYAHDMLASIDYLKPALDIPYCHHERWDGTGYPRGLKGEEIPLAARIFAVVDVWDALQSDRPYRDAWTREKTVTYLKDQSGTHFDPQVVEAFLDLVGNS